MSSSKNIKEIQDYQPNNDSKKALINMRKTQIERFRDRISEASNGGVKNKDRLGSVDYP